MTKPKVKGWCPGALTPMESGDGWIVRVKPFGGRLRRAQADGLASLAAAHGNGVIDLSARGNVQLRGVTQASHTPLIEGLRVLGLVDTDAATEARRNIIVTPFWLPGDETETLAAELTDALVASTLTLPGKFGFAIDTGARAVLQNASADIRLELDAGGGLILVADGLTRGKPVTSDTAIDQMLELAAWFAQTRGTQKRMKGLLKAATPPAGFIVPRQMSDQTQQPGPTPTGALIGLAFGQMNAATLAALAKHGALRTTPWRMFLIESARSLPEIDGVITDPDHPLLRVAACVGAPNCPQGLGETRALAAELAPRTSKEALVHVSGCAKGCAHPRSAAHTVVATARGYDLIRNGTTHDTPDAVDLTRDALLRAF